MDYTLVHYMYMWCVFAGYSSLPRSTMSEPLGCSGQLTSTYGPESTLETVPEDARRQTGKKHAYTCHKSRIQKIWSRKLTGSLTINKSCEGGSIDIRLQIVYIWTDLLIVIINNVFMWIYRLR